MSNQQLSPLGALAAGAVAGAVGTLAMDLVWWTRARMNGSDQSFVEYEFSTGSTSDYDEAATPAWPPGSGRSPTATRCCR